jgi:predicted ATP-grasp superfamily ATP-dependent carboligase
VKALVANARSASSLAVIRSLGRKGIEITGVSDSNNDFPLYSKYCRKKILLRSDPNDNERRMNELLEVVRNNQFDVFLPLMSENSLLELAKRRDDFEKFTRLALPSFDQLSILNDKAKVSGILEELGMPCPETFLVGSGTTLESIVKTAEFPLIIKPFRGEGAKGVKIVNNPAELKNSYNEITKAMGPALVQKFIPGIKHTAVFLLNKESEVRRFFVHRALREFPVSGGPTCYLKSVKYEPIYEYGLRLLKQANFTGLAAMEFIIDSNDGKPKIIDVNPRFYGPLQCAIAAGVDLPFAVFNMALNGDIETDFSYREDVTCRHLLFEDTKHLVSVLRGVKTPKYTLGKMATLVNYLNFFQDDSDFILSLSDPLPALKKIFRWL